MLPFNTDVPANSDVCFIKGNNKGKQTLLNTLGGSFFLATQAQAEEGYVTEKNGLIFLHM